MGCSSSKLSRARSAGEDCYAPLSRSVSAPIHHPALSEGESCHVVSLTSSSYGILNVQRPGYLAEGGSFLKLAKKNQVFCNDADEFVSPSSSDVESTKIKPAREDDNTQRPDDDRDLEVINTWELMQGLEDGGGHNLAPLKALGARKRICPERSISFGAVQGLESTDTELSSPVRRKYFSQFSERDKLPHLQGEGLVTPPPMSPFKIRSQPAKKIIDADALSVSSVEPRDGNSISGLLPSSAKISPGHTSSSCKDASGHGTCSDADAENSFHDVSQDDENSDSLARSSSGNKGSLEFGSSAFDPALVATFEQALEKVTGAGDEWLLLHADVDGSTTHSSTPSENNTWVFSEISSDAESLQEQNPTNCEENSVQCCKENALSRSKVMPVDGKEEHLLGSFELRCPPRGEEKVVLYFTSLRGIRKTYEACCDLRLILQGFGVKVDERDVWMHCRFKEELTLVLGEKKLAVPRLFIRGRYIGGADEVKQLHEDGILARLVQGLPTELCKTVCDGCGDLRFIPCVICSGSCKVLDEHDQVAQCSECNENGLMMCPLCN